jgi:predicted transcriptional regulator
MTVHLTDAQEKQLDHLAALTQRSKDEIAQEALDSYLRHIEALTAEVREGEESAQAEGWLSHDDVFDRLKKHLPKTA